jgi:hypothetical protein
MSTFPVTFKYDEMSYIGFMEGYTEVKREINENKAIMNHCRDCKYGDISYSDNQAL